MEDFHAEKVSNIEETITFSNFSAPKVDGDSPQGCHDDRGEAVACSAADVHMWLGGVACGLEGGAGGGAPGDYVSTFTPPEPLTTHQYGIRTRWTGMLTAQHLCAMVMHIR